MMPGWTYSDFMEPGPSSVVNNMSKTDILRGVITEKLTTAAREILAVMEKTIADYEEEASAFRQEINRQRSHLEILLPVIKIEPADDQQFPVCEAGGSEVPKEEPLRYELRVEDSQSLGICNTEEPMEEDDHEETAEEQIMEQETETSLSAPETPSHRKSVSRSQISDQDHIVLKICILEDSTIEVLSKAVYKKYPLHKLKCPCGLQEADFVNLLKSTFPQLADDRPYDLFKTSWAKKLQPLEVETFTPEEVSMTAGTSSIYIRLKVTRLVHGAVWKILGPFSTLVLVLVLQHVNREIVLLVHYCDKHKV
ncbi:uncharacterized protein LOC121640481 [Melanotaenia boesemani]|uniref:uncharacterized protein LOC121640481 n=1 Tax=Melanotaenia boesemani TaxID=1250792 RepID=UPI001C05B552|nr:uncharacterized protein LOC121640481 [Melanotaenia boesemani]